LIGILGVQDKFSLFFCFGEKKGCPTEQPSNQTIYFILRITINFNTKITIESKIIQ